MAVTIQSPTDFGGSNALLHGQGQNVPLVNKMRFDIGLAPGGPYTVHSSPVVAGLNTPAQNTAYQIPAGTLNPLATYYVVLRELDAANAVVGTSGETSFATTSSGEIGLICLAPCVVNAAIPFPWTLPPPYVLPTP